VTRRQPFQRGQLLYGFLQADPIQAQLVDDVQSTRTDGDIEAKFGGPDVETAPVRQSERGFAIPDDRLEIDP
jgi:hypothetical protein